MDRFEALNLFVTVAHEKSFTRAAEKSYLPRSTVSTAIKKLEQRLQVRLFHRTTRRVELTPEGQRFYHHSQEVLAALEQAEQLFADQNQPVSGRVRVDMTPALAEHAIIPHLPEFLARYPELHLEIGHADRHLDLIQEEIDCAIRAGTGHESGLSSQAIGEMSVINCASPAYLERYGTPRGIEDLNQHHLVLYVQHFGGAPEKFEYLEDTDTGNLRVKEIKLSGLITVNTIGGYKSACLAGLGICQIPLMGVTQELKTGRLVQILPELQASPMPLRWVYPYTRHIPRRVQVFMDAFQPYVEHYLEASVD